MNILLGIPVYNEEENINPFFEHLFSKLPEEINKIIVINDGSTDNSKKLLKNIKKKYFLKFPKKSIINYKDLATH
jgi:glycosyltransferase involved in cell wall biosynthesis